MSETSGFFLSQGGDRRYTPDWLAKYISALVTTGVYRDELGVTAPGGMGIAVQRGRAWITGYLYELDTVLPLSVAAAHASQARKDSVVVRLDLNERTIHAMVLTGTPAAVPSAPEPVRTDEIYDIKLAEVAVPAGLTAVTQSQITDCRLDDTVCGIVAGAVDHIPTQAFLAQMEDSFNRWFDAVKDALTQDAAGNLYTMIQALSYTLEFTAASWTASETECTITIPAAAHKMTGDTVSCQAFALKDEKYLQNTWAAMETWAVAETDGAITLHYPHTAGYAGRAVLSMTSPPVTSPPVS